MKKFAAKSQQKLMVKWFIENKERCKAKIALKTRQFEDEELQTLWWIEIHAETLSSTQIPISKSLKSTDIIYKKEKGKLK